MTKAGEYIDLLRQLIRIPSPSFGEDGACSLLSSFLDSSGLPHRRHGNNLIVPCRDFSPERKTLAMLAHVDTVPPADGYTRDPYDPGTDDSIIYGLGANDDGGSVVSMIATFRHFFGQHLPFNLLLVLGCRVYGARPSRLLRWRADRAAKYLKAHPQSVAVLSGGQGRDEAISEAEAMRRLLTQAGIAPSRLLLEDKSTSTQENIAFSGEILAKNGLSDRPVGVDIEHIRPVSQRTMRRLADVGTERAFFQSWVRREARTKRSGTGVGTMLDAETPLQPGEQFYFLDTFPGYVAGVSTKGGGPPGPVRKYALDEMMER